MSFDQTKVPDLEKRLEAERLQKAAYDADEVFENANGEDNAEEDQLDAEYAPRFAALATEAHAAEVAARSQLDDQINTLRQQRDAELQAIEDKYAPQLTELSSKRNAAVNEARLAARDKRRALENERNSKGPLAELRRKRDETDRAYRDFDAPAIAIDDDGEMIHCKLSGAPIFETDRVLDDEKTGGKVLRLLVLPDEEPNSEEKAA